MTDPSSLRQVNSKMKFLKLLDVDVQTHQINPLNFEQNQTDLVNNLNISKSDAIILQYPLNDEIMTNVSTKLNKVEQQQQLNDMIIDNKDLDVIKPKYKYDKMNNEPLTPKGLLLVMMNWNVKITDKIVIFGNGVTVGRPLRKILKKQGYLNVVVIYEYCSERVVQSKLENCRVMVSAVGRHGIIKPEQIKNNILYLECGCEEIDGVLKGDCLEENQKGFDKYLPVYKGTGQITLACAYWNLINCYLNANDRETISIHDMYNEVFRKNDDINENDDVNET